MLEAAAAQVHNVLKTLEQRKVLFVNSKCIKNSFFVLNCWFPNNAPGITNAVPKKLVLS